MSAEEKQVDISTTVTTTTTTAITTPVPKLAVTSTHSSSREKDLWSHENPHLNQVDVEMHDLPEEDPILKFEFKDVPKKIREAEQFYDKCDYNVSTAILVKCIELYDAQYGQGWCPKALEQDRELVELHNCDEILEFARLLKEYALNMILLAKCQDSLSVEVDEEGKPLGLVAEDKDGNEIVGTNSDVESDGEIGGGAFDDDSDDECEEDDESKDTYYSFATENLQLAFQIFGRYIIERCMGQPDIMEVRQIKVNGEDANLQYALGVKASINIPASDLLPFLWRGEDGVTIKRLEICQVYLGDVYDSLSDVHIEEEQWEDAARYLALSLKLRQRTEKAYGRALASIHTKYATYYSLRNQYVVSNKHWNLAASVFAFRALDKMDWLYRNFKIYQLAEKCPNILDISIPDDTTDEKLSLSRENIDQIRDFTLNQLIPCVKNTIYCGQEISDNNVNAAINNIIDYFSIIDSIYELYDDNLQDIAESKNEEGKTIDQEIAGGQEAQRVKNMVQEVMRTDELKESIKGKDINEALGFKKINKTGDIATTLGFDSEKPLLPPAQPSSQFLAPTADGEVTHIPTVKRRVKPVSDTPNDEIAVKKQRTE